MEIIRSYHVFEGQNSRFRKKNETKRIIRSKTKWVFNKSGSFTILTGTAPATRVLLWPLLRSCCQLCGCCEDNTGL